MIIKIQRPLTPTPDGEKDLAMVYNESRSYQVLIPLEDVYDLFKNNELRIYHKAKLHDTEGSIPIDLGLSVSVSLQTGETAEATASSPTKRLKIGRRIENQRW